MDPSDDAAAAGDIEPAEPEMEMGVTESTRRNTGIEPHHQAGQNSIMEEFEQPYQYDYGEDVEAPTPTTKMWNDPRLKRHWRTVLTGILLLVAGVGLLITAIVQEVVTFDAPRSFVFFILAGICLLPGGYVTFITYKALKGHKGYNFDMLPHYDDDDY